MILDGTQRLTKRITVVKRVLLMLTSTTFEFCHETFALCIFDNFVNFPVTEHDNKKWCVLKNDQNWKIELFVLYLANGKTWMGTDIETVNKCCKNGV